MPAAFAAPGDRNAAVVVSDIDLTHSDGSALTEQITVGDELLLKGTWDATTADPQPGEIFTIGLPVEFNFVLGGPPISLNGVDPVTGDAVTWATCVPNDAGNLTCEFTDAVVDREEIHGEFTFDVIAANPTEATEVVFDLNGDLTPVELPDGGGIDDGKDPLPDEVKKSGKMNGNNWSMTWTIDIPGASLVAAGGNVA